MPREIDQRRSWPARVYAPLTALRTHSRPLRHAGGGRQAAVPQAAVHHGAHSVACAGCVGNGSYRTLLEARASLLEPCFAAHARVVRTECVDRCNRGRSRVSVLSGGTRSASDRKVLHSFRSLSAHLACRQRARSGRASGARARWPFPWSCSPSSVARSAAASSSATSSRTSCARPRRCGALFVYFGVSLRGPERHECVMPPRTNVCC